MSVVYGALPTNSVRCPLRKLSVLVVMYEQTDYLTIT